jgi:hypothetical protein
VRGGADKTAGFRLNNHSGVPEVSIKGGYGNAISTYRRRPLGGDVCARK